MVQILPLNSKSSRFSETVETVPRLAITSGIILTFNIFSFFGSLTKLHVFVYLSAFFYFYTLVNQKGKIH